MYTLVGALLSVLPAGTNAYESKEQRLPASRLFKSRCCLLGCLASLLWHTRDSDDYHT